MALNSSRRVTRRNSERDPLPSEPPPKSPNVPFLSSPLLLLKIPADTDTSLPVWDAARSQHVDVTWNVNPYSISVNLTPMTSHQVETISLKDSAGSPAQTHGILQSQMVIHPISQQQSITQETSCIMVMFPQSSKQIQTSPNLATSLIISPPIITQPQPTCPPSTTKKPKSQFKVPKPSHFHTKPCSSIIICDNFLLGLCSSGWKCKMHHTPYPFHWQLWSRSNCKWTDFPPHSQVLLERIYSDVEQEGVVIKDGHARCFLNFDTMDLVGQSEYAHARHLTNSVGSDQNQYFPNRWRLYWSGSLGWKEYDKSVSNSVLKSMSKKNEKCSFQIGSRRYLLNFRRMTQTNIITGFRRRVRLRSVYRSPASMHPYLQTGVLTEPSTEPLADNFMVDPLEDFSTWYPPVWSPSLGQDYSLVDVPEGSRAFKTIQKLFHESLRESCVNIIMIQQVQNLLHWDKYQRQKAYMQKKRPNLKDPLERHLFHGTTKESAREICHNNFDPRLAGANGTRYGLGSYFATAASHSNMYSALVDPWKDRHMFLAKVLVGMVSKGKKNYKRPQRLRTKEEEYGLYDACVDDKNDPLEFVVFDSCQCYPYFLIKYRELPDEVEI